LEWKLKRYDREFMSLGRETRVGCFNEKGYSTYEMTVEAKLGNSSIPNNSRMSISHQYALTKLTSITIHIIQVSL